MPAVERRIFKSATEFVDELAGLSRKAGAKAPREWIYRGHGSASYELIPSSLRNARAFLLSAATREWSLGIRDRVWDQLIDELFTVLEFFRDVDASGLFVPEDSQGIRAELVRVIASQDEYIAQWRGGDWAWPPRQLLSLVAMAQHYGVHTRLLDWSYDPLIAAYFAAKDGVDRFKTHEADELVVWALDRRTLKFADVVEEKDGAAPDGDTLLEFVTAPSAWNPNLRAQRGLFTLLRTAEADPDQPCEVVRVDAHIQSRFAATHNPVLIECRLPCSQAGGALRELAHRFVTASAVFPGYAGSAAAILERKEWQ